MERFETRSAAMKREREIKKRKSRKYILGLTDSSAGQGGERLPLSGFRFVSGILESGTVTMES
jgi:hypothetical protein